MNNRFSCISLVLLSTVYLSSAPDAVAQDCNLTINSKEAVSCLQRKVVKLEKQLNKRNQENINFPRGAVIEFNAKACPTGWSVYGSKEVIKVAEHAENSLIKCQKQ